VAADLFLTPAATLTERNADGPPVKVCARADVDPDPRAALSRDVTLNGTFDRMAILKD